MSGCRPRAVGFQGVTVEPMIGYLSGRAISERIVLTGGVGYVVHTPKPLTVGADVALFVTTHVREDAITLFGFITEAEQTVFESLVKLPGVGAQTALALLRDVGLDGVASREAKILQKANGVGAKLAARIAAELVLPDGITDAADEVPSTVLEVAGTLEALGFPMADAMRSALRAFEEMPDAGDEELIAAGLRYAREGALA